MPIKNVKTLAGFLILAMLLVASCVSPPPVLQPTPTRLPATPTPTATSIIRDSLLTQESIVFQSFRNGEESIYSMRTSGLGQSRLVNGVDPAWSPDGTYLAYSQVSDDRDMIFLMGRGSSDVVQLTSGFTPAWSPDGKSLAISDMDAEGKADIFLLDIESLARQQLTSDPADELNPSWSPDGRRIVFERNGQIVIINVADQQQTVLSAGGSIDATPAWSPDGQTIAISSRLRDTNGNGQIDYNDNSYIVLMNADGTNRAAITAFPEGQGQALWAQSPAWSEDGTKLVFESNQSGQWDIWIVNRDGSAAENLTDDAPGSVNLNPQWRSASN